MKPNNEYLEDIKAKLDRMNKLSGQDPANKLRNNQIYGEPKLEDPMDWAGKSAIEYLRAKGKNPNLSDI